MEKTVILIDRDGTMGGESYIEFPWQYSPYPGTKKAFEMMNENGFFPIIVTNQSCIARGKAGDYDFAAEFREIGAADWFICPHDNQDHCDCRKPESGLILQAQEKYGLDLSKAYMIGDRWSDMVAGGRVGTKLILVRTGRGEEALGCDRDKWSEHTPEYIAENLYDAVCWLCKQK